VREELNERQVLVREELKDKALVREELQERQALVREELNQEILKMAKEKESQIVEEKSPQTIILMATHPPMQKEVRTRQSDRTITTQFF